MIRIHRLSFVFLAILALLCVVSSAQAQAPSLAGMVVKAGGDPLQQAQIELLVPDTDKVTRSVYTDSRGRFLLRGVATGRYDLRVKFGSRVVTQVIEEGGPEAKERRAVELGSEPQRLIVRVRG